jgi:hypothetical protein
LTAVSVFTLAILACLLSAIVFVEMRETVKSRALNELGALTVAKRAALESQISFDSQGMLQWAHGRIGIDAGQYADSGIQDLLRLNALRSSLIRALSGLPYTSTFDIADKQGKIFISTEPSREGMDLSADSAFLQGMQTAGISDLRQENGNYFLDIEAPIVGEGGLVQAVMIQRLPATNILDITGDYTSLGETGETTLAARRGDNLYFLAPRRFEAHYENPLPIAPLKDAPMVLATAGQTGTTIGPDYRDKTVLAGYAPLSIPGWGIAVKQDEA